MAKTYFISRSILAAIYNVVFNIKIYGRENVPDAPYLVVSNHASYLDPPLVGIAIAKDCIDFMAKKELLHAPVLGAWCRAVGCIEVRRGENSVRAIKEAIRRLKAGRCVSIFPEGTRSMDGTLQEARRGAGFIIANARVPVLPVYLEGTVAAMPRKGRLAFRTRIRVFIGKPVMPEELAARAGTERDYGAIAESAMREISLIKSSAAASHAS